MNQEIRKDPIADTPVVSAKPAKDVRPALPVSDQSLWEQSARKLEEFADLVERGFKQKNYVAWIRKSKPGEYPMYLLVESWIPVAETEVSSTFDRSSLKITLEVEPYSENPFIYKVELKRQAKTLTGSNWDLNHKHLSEFVSYLLEGGPKPKFFKSRVSFIARLVSAFIPGVGNEPTNKLIAEAKPNYFTVPTLLGWGGAIIAGIGLTLAFSGADESIVYLVIGIAMILAAFYFRSRRPNVDAVPKQSRRSPRTEFRFDSWHVSVPNAAKNGSFTDFKSRIQRTIKERAPDVDLQVEVHQHFTPRGFDERERFVITQNQTTLHIHIYPFGNDVFVGWESYLNWGRWEESKPVSRTVRDGKNIIYRSLDVGVYIPNDFDLIEAEALAESIHRIITDEIKLWLKERDIEAELDFQIIRASRETALTQGKKEQTTRKTKVLNR